MGKKLDLTGKTFGRLTVLKENGRNKQGQVLWLCECSCSEKTLVNVCTTNLNIGRTKSCGCLKREKAIVSGKNKVKYLKGKQFGRLTVLERCGSNKHKKALWKCICCCNEKNIVITTGGSLRNGSVKSCGCLRKETVSKITMNRKLFNKFRFDYDNNIAIGYTNNTNHEFIIDLDDYNKIKDYTWHESDKGYVFTTMKGKHVYLHRFILNMGEYTYDNTVDHIYHNTFDNRKSQLRKATQSQQSMNQGVQHNNTSGVTGLSWNKKLNKWHVSICVNGKNLYLGVYSNIEDAISIRKQAEKKYFKEYRFKKIE